MNNDLTVADAFELVAKLEGDIRDLIANFSKVTGFTVRGVMVDVLKLTPMGGSSDILYTVDVEIHL